MARLCDLAFVQSVSVSSGKQSDQPWLLPFQMSRNTLSLKAVLLLVAGRQDPWAIPSSHFELQRACPSAVMANVTLRRRNVLLCMVHHAVWMMAFVAGEPQFLCVFGRHVVLCFWWSSAFYEIFGFNGFCPRMLLHSRIARCDTLRTRPCAAVCGPHSRHRPVSFALWLSKELSADKLNL